MTKNSTVKSADRYLSINCVITVLIKLSFKVAFGSWTKFSKMQAQLKTQVNKGKEVNFTNDFALSMTSCPPK